MMKVIDGHASVGANRDISLSVEELLAVMGSLGIDMALISPGEHFLPVRNREGNDLVTSAAQSYPGQLMAYAVASPWLGATGLDELRRAHQLGARALKHDPALQGFDLLDGLVDPSIELAIEWNWPIYVRTGTPPHGLPLQLALLAQRYPEAAFIMGRSGTTDFAIDGQPALRDTANLYADTVYTNWPAALASLGSSAAGADRIVLTTDAPFGNPAIELARVREALIETERKQRILGGTLQSLLGEP